MKRPASCEPAPHTETWQRHLGDLSAWLQQSQGEYPKQNGQEDGENRLACWMKVQRAAYLAGRLQHKRQHALEALLGWQWQPYQASWSENLEALHTWSLTHPNAYPCRGASYEPEKSLSRWINNQRCDYWSSTLPYERRAALEALPGWSWHVYEDAWMQGYLALEVWARRFGAAYPRQHATEDHERKLAEWINHQRVAQQGDNMDADRKVSLEALPHWSWEPLEDQWAEWFSLAEAWFYASPWSRESPRPQHPCTAAKHVAIECCLDLGAAEKHLQEDIATKVHEITGRMEIALGRWMLRQKCSFAKGNLSAARMKRLESLPEWLWPWQPAHIESDAGWNHAFTQLLAWKQHRFNIRHEVLQLGHEPCKLPTRWRKASLYEQHLAIWFDDNLGQMRNAGSVHYPAIGCYSLLGDGSLLPRLPSHRLKPFLRFIRGGVSMHVGGRHCVPEFQAALVSIDSQLIAEGAHKRPFSTIGCKCCVPELHDDYLCCFPRHHGANSTYYPMFVWGDGRWMCTGPKFAFTAWMGSPPPAAGGVPFLSGIPMQTIGDDGGDVERCGADASPSASSSLPLEDPQSRAHAATLSGDRCHMDVDDF